jgi:SSS family transporter
MSFETILIVLIAVFLAVLVFEGIVSFRRSTGEADFMVAGRSAGPWIVGTSLSATQMSAGTFVGTIGVHYLTGASFIWIWTGIWLAYIVAGLFIAPKFRQYSAEHGGLTFPDYIGHRFNSNLARGIAAVLIVIAFVVYMSAQYQAGGVIFETIFGIPFVYGALLLMAVTVLYTLTGGMVAVMRTDFLQQVAMAVGIVVGIPLVIKYAGGWNNVGAALADISPTFLGWEFGFRELLGFGLAFGLGFVAAPTVLVRFFAARDDRTVRQAVAVALLFNVLTATAVAIVAMCVRVLYPQLFNADAASTVYASQVLPPFVGALVLLAVIAAVLSTVDSVLLVAGPAISYDLYFRVINPGASERARLLVTRAAILVVGAIPVLLTLFQLALVQFVVAAYTSILASIVVVPVLVGLYWRRASKAGVVGSMVIGFAVCLLWFAIGQPFINPVVPGVLASAIAIFAISLATRPVPTENLRPFFAEPAVSGARDAE